MRHCPLQSIKSMRPFGVESKLTIFFNVRICQSFADRILH